MIGPERDEVEAALRDLVAAILGSGNRFYAERLRAAELSEPARMTLSNFVEKCPFTFKQEIVDDHIASPPYGTNLCRPASEYTRISRTSGTSGVPMSWPDSASSWDSMLDAWQAIYEAAGIKAGEDRISFAFSFGPFLGFWTAFESAVRMGCMAIPGGGLSSGARFTMIHELGATVLCCTPTYALRLGEFVDRPHQVEKIIVAGEPGGCVPAVREQIGRAWGGAEVFDHHGMTEVGPVSFEPPAARGNLCLIPGVHFGEVIDPVTGKEVDEGEEGELVLTTLRRLDRPLLRYRTGDLVRKKFYDVDGQCLLGFEGGVLGRIDDMVVVRGVNIYPAAIDAVLREFAQIAEYQVLVREEKAMAEAQIRIELREGSQSAVVQEIGSALRDVFSLRIPVEQVECGTLPRFEFKAKRWLRQ